MVCTLENIQNLQPQLEELRKKGKKIVFTNGCFDLLHVGHVRYLSEAKKLGDVLVVGVNSDQSVKKLKGPQRPVQSEQDRAEILTGLKAVDHAVIFSEETPEKLIQSVKPDVLVKGGDWTVDKIVGAPYVQSYGGQVYSLSFVEGKSTTRIIEKMSRN